MTIATLIITKVRIPGTNHLPSEALSHWRKYTVLNPTASLTEEQAKHILGTQANLWTEYIPTSEQVEYMVLPRMAALAEVQWTQLEKKDYTNFTTRLAGLIGLYRRDGLNYPGNPSDSRQTPQQPRRSNQNWK